MIHSVIVLSCRARLGISISARSPITKHLITIMFPVQSDFVLVAVILLSNKYKVNPDNMATPLAASIGDVVSISMLSFITSILFSNLGKFVVPVR